MIIQCEKCQTRFRLDDSRVTDKDAKVRCTKCKYVFTVQKKEPEIASFEPDDALAEFSFSDTPDEVPEAASEDQDFATEFVPDESLDTDIFESSPADSGPVDFSSFETSNFDDSALSFEPDEPHDGIDVNSPAVNDESAADDNPADNENEVDFSGFDFNDGETESEPPSVAAVEALSDRTIESAPVTPQKKESPQGLDFSDDAMFGAVVPDVAEPLSNTISFDFGDDSFTESMGAGGQDSTVSSGTSFSLDSHGDVPFNLGEIDFGDELTSVAVQQVNPDDLKPSQEILFAPLAEKKNKSTDDEFSQVFLGDIPSGDQQELPPLSIASRRKDLHISRALIAVIAFAVISVVGFFGFSSFSNHSETALHDAGKISVKSVIATFIDNDEAGELLVISGEALNEYAEIRAALQVKVTIFDADGQSIATKNAYGGNPLTEEQLESLSLDKIEAAMANQFGDSLANMEVAPGKAIPFVIVLANLPKGAKDFEVQSAGSTVAAGKQQ